ncbi:MAG: LutB/LldF family L-lactate oxidation iron-sulfur protein [candidate division KSB1 bacterium]|nr:LutB/LldF family L-lactate oxidation iron-sulfur protein [candidate division KSB1 bacterium]
MSLQTSRLPLKKRIRRALSDDFMRASIAAAQDLINRKRQDRFAELGDIDSWREAAAEIRAHTLDHLDFYLDRFVTQAEASGCRVYFADDAAEANRIAAELLGSKKARKAVKSKSMVTEEIGLNEALQEIGVEVIETDLGEYLLQIDDADKPSHIVIPALHKDRERFRRVLAEKKGYSGDAAPENMTRFVRGILRQEFLTADVGITGCNFAVAETGTLVLVTNEGNGRFVTTLPKTQLVFLGMERLVPTLSDLDVLLTLLPRSAVGSRASVYTTLLTGPRRANELDGPDEIHIIIVDNGRSEVLGSPFRDVLRCIRCGTCMLECPAYRHISGHGYGALYPGPLGAALMPTLGGYPVFKEIVKICSLCGACDEVCPVKIPLHKLIFEHRRRIAEELGLNGRLEDGVFAGAAMVLGSPFIYRATTKAAFLANLAPRIGPVRSWTKSRCLMKIPTRRFRDWYKAHRAKEGS